MKNKSYQLTGLFLAFFLTSVGVSASNSSEKNVLHQVTLEPESNLINTNWQLVNYLNSQGKPSLPYSKHEPTLKFFSDRVAGTSGCNQITGSYQLGQQTLSFQRFAATQKACITEGLSEQEQQYLKALAQVAFYQLENEQLQLKNSQGQNILTFEKIKPASLTQNLWQLQQYNNGRGGVVSLLKGTEITLVMDEQGKLSGNAGCNQYQSQWKIDSEKLQINPPGSTKKFCSQPENLMEQETAYLANLEKVNSWEIVGDNLIFKDVQGNTLATYQATFFRD